MLPKEKYWLAARWSNINLRRPKTWIFAENELEQLFVCNRNSRHWAVTMKIESAMSSDGEKCIKIIFFSYYAFILLA